MKIEPLTDKDLLVEVYNSVIQQGQFYTSLFEKWQTFYTGLVTAILGGLAWASVNGHTNSPVFLLGGALIIAIAHIGKNAATNSADQINRIMTERAKLEQAIGLTAPFDYEDSEGVELYWADEPVIATKHLETRNEHTSSVKFLRRICTLKVIIIQEHVDFTI